MRLFRHFQNLPADLRGAVVAVGNFDGVHLGHQAVIGEAGRIARANGCPWATLTFEPHPRSVFQPDGPAFRLSPLDVKARLIEALGPDAMIVVPFDLDFSRLSAHDFVERVLVNALGARHVVCGHDFAFGHQRKGGPEVLLRQGDEFGFGFTCVQEVRDTDGEPYSSTRIRRYLQDGDPRAAARLLGRPFDIEGDVLTGEQRGRLLGFPTANLGLGDYLCPARGVYAVRCLGDGVDGVGGARDGVANLGLRPTFDGQEVLLEAHLFDFDGDLYGRTLRVQLIEYLRPERSFESLDALRAQIGEDSVRARQLLSDHAVPLARAGNL
jgi:riboflavin kinase/FMN adenylyltransferase